MTTMKFLLVLLLASGSACQAELPRRKLPTATGSGRYVEVGAYSNSTNCHGLQYTSYEKACVDTIHFVVAGDSAQVETLTYLDSEQRIARVEMAYSMPVTSMDTFVQQYRNSLQEFGWILKDTVPNTMLTLKKDILLATDSTMSVWMYKPSFSGQSAELWISCFIRVE